VYIRVPLAGIRTTDCRPFHRLVAVEDAVSRFRINVTKELKMKQSRNEVAKDGGTNRTEICGMRLKDENVQEKGTG